MPRGPKFETNSNDQKYNVPNKRYRIRRFGIAQGFDLFGLGLFRISIFEFWIYQVWQRGGNIKTKSEKSVFREMKQGG